MEPMTWYEILGERWGWYRWCPDCHRMRWFHPRPGMKRHPRSSNDGLEARRKQA